MYYFDLFCIIITICSLLLGTNWESSICSLNTFIVVRSCSSMLSTSKVTLITLSVQTFIVRRGMFCVVSWGCWLLLDATAWEDDSGVCGGRGSKQSRLQPRLSWTIAPLKLQTKQSRHQHLFAPFRMFLPAGRCCKEDARMRSSIPEMQALEFQSIPELSWLEWSRCNRCNRCIMKSSCCSRLWLLIFANHVWHLFIPVSSFFLHLTWPILVARGSN